MGYNTRHGGVLQQTGKARAQCNTTCSQLLVDVQKTYLAGIVGKVGTKSLLARAAKLCGCLHHGALLKIAAVGAFARGTAVHGAGVGSAAADSGTGSAERVVKTGLLRPKRGASAGLHASHKHTCREDMLLQVIPQLHVVDKVRPRSQDLATSSISSWTTT